MPYAFYLYIAVIVIRMLSNSFVFFIRIHMLSASFIARFVDAVIIIITIAVIIITAIANNHFLTPNTFPRLPYLRFRLIMVILKNEGWYCG